MFNQKKREIEELKEKPKIAEKIINEFLDVAYPQRYISVFYRPSASLKNITKELKAQKEENERRETLRQDVSAILLDLGVTTHGKFETIEYIDHPSDAPPVDGCKYHASIEKEDQ